MVKSHLPSLLRLEGKYKGRLFGATLYLGRILLSSAKESGRNPGGRSPVMLHDSPLQPVSEIRWSHAAAGLVGDLHLAKLSLLSIATTEQYPFDEANFSLLH